MASLNKVQLIGHIGREPEIRNLEGGNKVATLALAVSEKYKDRNGNPHESTEWVNLVAYGKLADIVEQFVHTGSLLYVDGKLKTRSWDGPDGKKNYRTEVVMKEMQMLNRVGSQSTEQTAHAQDDNEDIPF